MSAKATAEKKLADFLANSMNTLSIDHNFVVHHMSRYPAAIHANVFDLILAFLNRYAMQYSTGQIVPGDQGYQRCETAARMLDALTVTENNGKHCAE